MRHFESTDIHLEWPFLFPARTAMEVGKRRNPLPAQARKRKGARFPDRTPYFIAAMAVSPIVWWAKAGAGLHAFVMVIAPILASFVTSFSCAGRIIHGLPTSPRFLLRSVLVNYFEHYLSTIIIAYVYT